LRTINNSRRLSSLGARIWRVMLKRLQHVKGARQWQIAVYVLLFAGLVMLKLAEDAKPVPERSDGPRYLRYLSGDYWYRFALGEILYKPADRRVVLLLLREEDTPKDPCARRLLEGTVASKVADTNPALIVFDAYFGPRTCPSAADNKRFGEMIAAASQKVPIVYGRGAHWYPDVRAEDPVEFSRLQRWKENEIVLRDTLRLEALRPDAPGRISEGALAVGTDTRRIPLRWPAFQSLEAVQHQEPQPLETLAVKALRAYHQRLSDALREGLELPIARDEVNSEYDETGRVVSEVSDLERNRRDPYTSFLSEQQLAIQSSMDLVCALSCQWSGCAHHNSGFGDVKFPIVVIGRVDPSDMHESIIGRVPGAVLQANYIESLVDGRIFQPLATGWQVFLIVLWLLMLGYISWRFARRIALALLMSVAGILVFLVVVEFAVVLLFKRYTDVLFPALYAAAILNFGHFVEAMADRGKAVETLASTEPEHAAPQEVPHHSSGQCPL